mgnify:CR=1 FL=1
MAWGGDDSAAASAVVMVTNIAAAAGAIGAMATTWLKDGKPNLGMTLNGAIAGLVAITAGCGNMTFGGGFLAGLVGGIIVVFSIEFIDRVLKIDDAVGAASAHGVVGAWGTLVIGLWGVDGDAGIGLFNGGGASQFGIQAIGVLAYGVWATVAALIGFGILKSTIGLRVSEEVEIKGLDESEHGIGGFEGGGFEAWIKEIYTPINRLISQIIKPLNNEIKELSADPYDDQLMENFCSYIILSQKKIEKVEKIYNKKIVPKSISALGLDLYHCFSQVKDALSEFDRYTQGYVDNYLFDGKEMIKEAKRIQSKMSTEKKNKNF